MRVPPSRPQSQSAWGKTALYFIFTYRKTSTLYTLSVIKWLPEAACAQQWKLTMKQFEYSTH